MSIKEATNIVGELVYITGANPPVEIFEVVGYDESDDFVSLRSLANKKLISGIHPHQLSFWHEMGGE